MQEELALDLRQIRENSDWAPLVRSGELPKGMPSLPLSAARKPDSKLLSAATKSKRRTLRFRFHGTGNKRRLSESCRRRNLAEAFSTGSRGSVELRLRSLLLG